jgi:hypothetical protein
VKDLPATLQFKKGNGLFKGSFGTAQFMVLPKKAAWNSQKSSFCLAMSFHLKIVLR